jgi:23S rRNA pseudouridine1911/1915/1917 synthase
MQTLIVDELNDGERIDKYLIEYLNLSRSKIQKLIENNSIKINNKEIKSSYQIKTDDTITIEIEETDESKIEPENIQLDICYEDEDIIVINKSSGMVVHPAPGHHHGTLVNALLYHCNHLSNVNGNIRPGIVHRIDKDTSGLLLIAKNDEAHMKLANDIQTKKVVRKYLALVSGIITHDSGTIDAPIGRDLNDRKKMSVTDLNARDAVTHFKVLERLNNATLIECVLETGRTHQIRAHMKYINHPIINDPIYGPKKLIDDSGQMLHAYKISFYHPKTNEFMEFEVPLPDKFNKALSFYRI